MSVIDCKNVWKRYKFYDGVRPSLKERLLGWEPFKGPCQPPESAWVLRDISFEVNSGEGFGILGRNGAGKSTLLRLLASILVPTQGEIEVKGITCPVLSLGVGFQPEFTGEENVYIAGSIFGKSEEEVNEIFDEIVEFSGLEDYIDAPVKFYSSGMLARLGFATALHMDPDIFLIDEALAVGDIGFQKKCVDKFLELKAGGKTFVFVSHSLDLLRKLCERTILLHDHRIFDEGETARVVTAYEKIIEEESQEKGSD